MDHAHSEEDMESVRAEIVRLGCQAWVFQADLIDSSAAESLIPLVNSAAILESQTLAITSLDDAEKHLQIIVIFYPNQRKQNHG